MSKDNLRFEQWKEQLLRDHGKQARLSKAWLEKEWARLNKKAKAAQTSLPTPATSVETLETIREDIGDCTRCKLHSTRTHIVFGEGNPRAELMFVGEGPGEQEDLKGRPFVGRAGQLLDKIIEAMGLKREDVYIANVVKCRPPSNRVPEPDEAAVCDPFLYRQIAVIQPKIVVALGATALRCLLKNDVKITKMRGQFINFHGTKLMPTYHPAFLLRNPPAKKDVWEDMKKVMAALGLKGKGNGAS